MSRYLFIAARPLPLLTRSYDAPLTPTRAPLDTVASYSPQRPPKTPPAWRPSPADVKRLSRGQAAKLRGTGSRAVPHRLNADEAAAFSRAQTAGFLTQRGGGVRRERKGSPLGNTWRMWCDACGVPAVVLRLAQDGRDSLVVDFAVLRLEGYGDAERLRRAFKKAADRVSRATAVEEEGWFLLENRAEVDGEEVLWGSDPTWRLPDVTISWVCPDRPTAKELAKALVAAWEVIRAAPEVDECGEEGQGEVVVDVRLQ